MPDCARNLVGNCGLKMFKYIVPQLPYFLLFTCLDSLFPSSSLPSFPSSLFSLHFQFFSLINTNPVFVTYIENSFPNHLSIFSRIFKPVCPDIPLWICIQPLYTSVSPYLMEIILVSSTKHYVEFQNK